MAYILNKMLVIVVFWKNELGINIYLLTYNDVHDMLKKQQKQIPKNTLI